MAMTGQLFLSGLTDMFPGEVTLTEVVREYLARDDYSVTVTDGAISEFLGEWEGDFDLQRPEDVLQCLVSIAYQRGATDASSLIGV
jgi:hypothetical protein